MKHPTKITILLIALFVASQLFGIYTFSRYLNQETGLPSRATPIGSIQNTQTQAKAGVNWGFLITIASALLIGTAIALWLIRHQKVNYLKLWIATALWANLLIVLGAYVPSIIAVLAAGILVWLRLWKFPGNNWLQNITEVMLYGGFAILFAFILNIWTLIILLIGISIYDYWAVFISKHMVGLAKMMDYGIFTGIMLSYKGNTALPDSNRHQPQRVVKGGILTKSDKNINIYSNKAILGGGDIAFSLLSAAVVFKISGLFPSLFVVFGTTIALTTLFIIAQKGKFYPAMPFITCGVLLGLLLGALA